MMLLSRTRQVAPALAREVLVPRPLSVGSARHRASAAAASPRPDAASSTPARPVEEIPGPPIYPLIGSLPTFARHLDVKKLHKFWMAMHERYGPIFRIVNPALPSIVVVSDPEDCEKVSKVTMADPQRQGFDSLHKVRKDYVEEFFQGKTGLVLENGEEWWRVRSRVQTPMMKPKKVSLYLERMDQVSVDFLERVATMQAELGEMPSNFQVELYKWALESVGLVALNRRLGCLDPNLDPDGEQMAIINTTSDMLHALSSLELGIHWWRLFPSPTFNKLLQSQKKFLSLLLPTISAKEEELNKGGWTEDDLDEMPLLETLLLTPGLSRQDVVTFMMDFFFAGIDTTSHALAFTLYLLARNPEAQRRLQKEIDEVVGSQTGPLTPQQLGQLSFLKAVLKESLRILPLTMGFARTLTEDVVLRGYNIPAGYMAICLTMASGWSEAHFPRAKEFLPERWLRDRPLGPIHPFSSVPFGIGTRMCIGRRLAEQEIFTLLVRMMQRFTVDYKYEDMQLLTKLIFEPSEPLRFTFTERR